MEKFRIPPVGTGNAGIHHSGVDSDIGLPQQPGTIKPNPSNSPYWKDSLMKKEQSPFTLLSDPVHPNRAKEMIKDRDIQEFVNDLHSIKRGFDELGISFDEAFQKAMRESFDLNEFCREVDMKLVQLQRSELKEVNQERLERIQETVKKVQTSKMWKHFANITAGVAGLVGILTTPLTGFISIPVSIGLILTMIGNTVDNCFDNRGKKAIGRLVTDGSDASAEKFAGYFGLGLAVVQLVFSFGLTLSAATAQNAPTFMAKIMGRISQNASTAIQMGSHSLGAGATIGKGVNDYRLGCSRADQMQTELDLSNSKDFMDGLMSQIKRISQQRSELASFAKEHLDMMRSIAKMNQI